MSKVWQILPPAPAEFKEKFPEQNPVVLQLLYNRGLDTQGKIDEFFNPDYETDIHDPFIFQDMQKAVDRIFQAVEKGEKIVVHGDYDADGVSSSALMMTVLGRLIEVFGEKDRLNELLSIYIPHREKEGYGLKLPTVEKLAKDKVNLLITVDCGVANAAEVVAATAAGIEVIITDHHQEPLILPKAFAIINPQLAREKYPFRPLAGVGVAFKVAQALAREAEKRKPEENWEGFVKWLLDLVAIGTVADVMPLLGENRTLVKYGLVVLNKTPRLGLQALLFKAGINGNGKMSGAARDALPKKGLNAYSIAFQIAPRLNAAGRMEHANTAYGLLMATDMETAEQLSDQIQESNVARQSLTETIVEQAQAEFSRQAAAGQKLLMVLGEGWPTGILGLVSGKLTDKFCRPSIVASVFDGKVVASGRSVAEFNIFRALQKVDKYFANYGGHPAACGFTLKNNADFSALQAELQALAATELKTADLSPVLEIAAAVKLDEISWGLLDELEKMEPFGEENPRPVLAVTGVTVSGVEKMGRDGAHLKILVKQDNGLVRKLIGFSLTNGFGNLQPGAKIDVAVEVGVNEWNGNRELQLKIVDMKVSS
ncbi:MAG: single-stranded-DNA-specific exonuclease RecJ [Patescibacteria group bacterium]|jgi:single-stranded-DNA-specific exonuclease